MHFLLDEPLPGDVTKALAERMVQRRKEHHMSQPQLAKASNVSLGSIRRFEQIHEISLTSLVNIAFALGCEADFAGLFATPYYETLEDVEAARKRKGGGRA